MNSMFLDLVSGPKSGDDGGFMIVLLIIIVAVIIGITVRLIYNAKRNDKK